MLVQLDHFHKDRDEHKNYLSCHHPVMYWNHPSIEKIFQRTWSPIINMKHIEVLWPYSLLVAQYKCTNLMMETTWINRILSLNLESIILLMFANHQTNKESIYESVQVYLHLYTYLTPTTSYRKFNSKCCFLHFLSDIILHLYKPNRWFCFAGPAKILSILILSCQEGALSGSTVIHPEVFQMIHDGNLTLMEEILHQLIGSFRFVYKILYIQDGAGFFRQQCHI